MSAERCAIRDLLSKDFGGYTYEFSSAGLSVAVLTCFDMLTCSADQIHI